jgi:hypothetical protein
VDLSDDDDDDQNQLVEGGSGTLPPAQHQPNLVEGDNDEDNGDGEVNEEAQLGGK